MSEQTFEEIHRECARRGTLFEDPDFSAENRSLFFSREPPRPFVWKRPGDIVQDPRLFVGGASRLDINQGMLGNCWFLAALSSLCQHPTLLHRVIPGDYDFGNNYAGVFRVNFWQYGEWKEVVIDDRLPTYNNRLVFVHSKENNEFWSALVEKAYAKVHGSYEALKGGQTSEAMVDLTGGVTETYDLGSKAPENLFQIMQKSEQRQGLIGCSINADPNQIEAKGDNGLVKGKAYSVTGVRKVKANTRRGEMDVELVRVRNPWGNEREWTGAWGDRSPEWGLLSDAEKRKLGLTYEDDGEFWMSYRDWVSNFSRVEICNLSADDEDPMEMKKHTGRWIRGATAGGCRNFPDTFHINPQIRFTVKTKQEDEESDRCSVVIALIQKDRRKLKEMGKGMLTIGYAIYKLDEENSKVSILPKDYFLYHASTARSSTFINSREITDRFEFLPGEYCLVPSTFDPNEEGEFILRVFTEKENTTCDPGAESFDDRPPRPEISREQSDAMDAKFKSFFLDIAGGDERISVLELQQIISSAVKSEMDGREVPHNVCRLLVRSHDYDVDGKLNYDEFKEMWVTFRQYLTKFKTYEQDSSKDLDLYELRGALTSLGFRLGNGLLHKVSTFHANKRERVSFDDFIEIVLKMQILFNSHTTLNGKSSTLDDFVAKLLY